VSKPLRRITIEEFARRLKVTTAASDKRFAFFLGAGCSVSSGVPSAGTLVKDYWLPRLRDLRAPSRKDLDTWASEILPDYSPSNSAAAYGQVIDQLFFQSEERQREIESLCDGRFPAFGYAVLSGLVTLEAGKFNVVLTTNFDDLIADALYLFTTARPLVIHHESLAAYIRPTRTRPLIVKLHGDHRLSPHNTARETATIKNEIEASVRTLLHDRGLIFAGYGGNDKGIQKMFEDLPTEALPLGVFWISEFEPQGIVRPWLESRNAVWVQKSDFDECMLIIRDEFQIQHPQRKRFDEVFDKYTETYKTLSARIVSLPDTTPEASLLKEAVRRTDQSFPDWRAVTLEAQRIEREDPDQAESIFRKGIAQFPQSGRLLADFANFIQTTRRDTKAASDLYERAIAMDATDSSLLLGFANFAEWFAEDYDRAESLFKRGLEIAPNESDLLGYYADFLARIRNNVDEAETLFERALKIDPTDSVCLSNYADFLEDKKKNLEKAEELLRQAVATNPSDTYALTHLANFLAFTRGDSDSAQPYFQRAIEADTENSFALRCYAGFLWKPRGKHDDAEELFKRALAADPRNMGPLVDYAEFLWEVRQLHEDAEKLFSRALELNPRSTMVLVPFARFLREVRKDTNRAAELEQRLKKVNA
jgi:tetratricopeptide (TPR) repeat protein